MKARVHVFELNRGAISALLVAWIAESLLLFGLGFKTGARWAARPAEPVLASVRAAAESPEEPSEEPARSADDSSADPLAAEAPAIAWGDTSRWVGKDRARPTPRRRLRPRFDPLKLHGLSEDGGRLVLRFERSQPVPPTPYGSQIYRAASRHAMNPLVVAAIVWVESHFDTEAVSTKGARGLMQVLPDTATRFGIRADQLFEPEHNLDVGVRYLRWLSDRYSGDPDQVLAGYNAGEGAVDHYGDVPPYAETRDYVRRVYSALGLERPASETAAAPVGEGPVEGPR